MNLPDHYKWLMNESAPQILRQALPLFGVVEQAGSGSNPLIMQWAKETGLSAMYSDDSVPWCGLFMAAVVKRAGHKPPPMALRALSWATWGNETSEAMLGDVLVFKRQGGGHVGIYVGEDSQAYHVLGGNQSDKVCITRISTDRIYAVRRTPWKIEQPPNIRVVDLAPDGELSDNEA